jgi:hypothetical protein
LSTKARRPTTWTSKVARAPNIVRVGDDEPYGAVAFRNEHEHERVGRPRKRGHPPCQLVGRKHGAGRWIDHDDAVDENGRIGPVAWVLPASDEREQAVWRGPMPGDGVSDDVERHGLYLAA